MKKRLLLLALMLFALTSASSALAAEEAEYLWYVKDYGTLMLSADGGASYAELPGLKEAQAASGMNYANTVAVTPQSDGGLLVQARDQWESTPSFTRTYSAREVADALGNATPTPVRVLCTNERGMTLGARTVYYTENYIPTGDIMADWRYSQSAERLVYTTDGVTWQEQPWPEGMSAADEAWWDGTDFCLYSGGHYVRIGQYTSSYTYENRCATSPDGLHWSVKEEEKGNLAIRGWSRGVDLGPYHFEVYNGEVYLMERSDWGTGVLLPHMAQAARDKGANIVTLQAWYGPGGNVILAGYDLYGRGGQEDLSVSIDYPTSSLDWCLENLSVPFRQPEKITENADSSIYLAADRGYSRALDAQLCQLLRNDGSGWKQVRDVPFTARCDLLPYNGKSFVVVDRISGELYFSEDGLTWTATAAVRPVDWTPGTYNRIECATAWTGQGYLVARKAWEYGHGPMSGMGGSWFAGDTKVYFLNEALQLADTYDFGRLVEGVGYYDGSYYAKVSNSAGTTQAAGAEGEFQWNAGSTLYTSRDGKNWTSLPDIYLELDELFLTWHGGERKGNLPTGDGDKPLRTVAQLDRWRFVLYERVPGYFDVYLLRGNANDMADLNMEQEIKSRWITPGELTAAYTADGKVVLTVQDLSNPTMQYSAAFTPQELDAMRDEGIGDWAYRSTRYDEEQQANDVDVGLMETMNGEKEVVYRDASTQGKCRYLEQVPWSNSVELLSYSGKDFMVLDKADGKVYLSADGKSWREATGEWIVGNRSYDRWDYTMCWVGDHYIATCMLGQDSGGGGRNPAVREWAADSRQVTLLDENLNKIGVGDRKGFLSARVGCRDGVCYLDEGWQICYSADGGLTWQPSDLGQVAQCLAPVSVLL